MLNATETMAILEARAALERHGEAALAQRLDSLLLAAAKHRASIADGARRGAGNGAGRPPTQRYIVECVPGWRMECLGSAAAHAEAARALTELGDKRATPTKHSMGVMLARKGEWSAIVDTDNGTCVVSVRKVTETGTDLANAKTVPKAEKRR